MFNLTERTLIFGGKTLPIVKWEVWFMTPFGLIADLQEANQRCIDNDMNPNQVVSPVPVALDSDERYEVILRG